MVSLLLFYSPLILDCLHTCTVLFYLFAGAVKDSVVGEERIAKYLLSLLNIRKTPLHWERLLHRREELYEETCDGNEKGSRDSLRRMRRFNNSDALYVQVLTLIFTICSCYGQGCKNLDSNHTILRFYNLD